jgi:hypothetical protein
MHLFLKKDGIRKKLRGQEVKDVPLPERNAWKNLSDFFCCGQNSPTVKKQYVLFVVKQS